MIHEPPALTILRDFPRPTGAQVAPFRDVPTGFVCDAMGGQGALASVIQPLGGGRDIDCRAVGPALVADNGPAEAALEEKVRGGYCDVPEVAAMIADGRAVVSG
ncbi:hypothetical protein [Mesobacterium pallidum]|uniref:hypothetical protein n=1 Tax=Mesobacterium pallidum TaxID=2872037 RepID=UPI001EE385E3|nr:hypothetical protein [Mesobacterium pallidum]